MAWLKFDTSTPEKPEVFSITVAMGWEDPDLTVGKLMKVWRWFDQHTDGGNAHGVTLSLLDRVIGVTGFAQAMVNVGWLSVTDFGLTLPNFDRHNGDTAKTRAQTAKRVAKSKSNAKGNAQVTQAPLPDALPREEKEKSNTSSLRSEVEPPRKRSAPVLKPVATVDELVQAGFPPETAAEFIAHKASMKAPLTERAWRDHLAEAEKAGWTPLQAAEKVMAKSWKGFEAKYVVGERPPIANRVTYAQQDEMARRSRWEEMTGRKWPDAKGAHEFIDVELQRIA